MGRKPGGDDQAGRYWDRVRARRLLLYLSAGALLVLAVVVLGKEIHRHFDAIEKAMERLGPWGMVAFIGVFILLTSLFVPDTVFAIAAGVLFGLGWGTAAVVAGGLLGGVIQYGLSRRMLRGRIEEVVASKPALSAIQRAVRQNEVRLQALVRLTPLSPVMTNYVLGAAGVRFPGFLIACLALVPAFFLEVYFGYAGKHLARMAGRDEQTVLLHDAAVAGGLVACVLVIVVISRTARRALMEAAAEEDEVLRADAEPPAGTDA